MSSVRRVIRVVRHLYFRRACVGLVTVIDIHDGPFFTSSNAMTYFPFLQPASIASNNIAQVVVWQIFTHSTISLLIQRIQCDKSEETYRWVGYSQGETCFEPTQQDREPGVAGSTGNVYNELTIRRVFNTFGLQPARGGSSITVQFALIQPGTVSSVGRLKANIFMGRSIRLAS